MNKIKNYLFPDKWEKIRRVKEGKGYATPLENLGWGALFISTALTFGYVSYLIETQKSELEQKIHHHINPEKENIFHINNQRYQLNIESNHPYLTQLPTTEPHSQQ
jgi:hypothetical protein